MKIKYLKKLKRRYSWKWIQNDRGFGDLGYWEVLDHKMKRVWIWRSARQFISSTLGFHSSVEFDRKRNERKKRAEYNRKIKVIK